MKERPVLYSVLILTLLVEVVLMVLVYLKVGSERLPIQIGRIAFQIIVIIPIVANRSNKALFVLAGYHIVFCGALGWTSAHNWLAYTLIAYHVVIGFVIYFHDVIERRLFPVPEGSADQERPD